LNEKLGGPGIAENLFPITARATADTHLDGDAHKAWMNEQKTAETNALGMVSSEGLEPVL
jgi:hypothetical protein